MFDKFPDGPEIGLAGAFPHAGYLHGFIHFRMPLGLAPPVRLFHDALLIEGNDEGSPALPKRAQCKGKGGIRSVAEMDGQDGLRIKYGNY
jgi:hypothetical protein